MTRLVAKAARSQETGDHEWSKADWTAFRDECVMAMLYEVPALLEKVDALSVRLAQECALRAQAEQERDEAWDTAHDEREKLVRAEVRLREYEEALTAFVKEQQ